MNKRIQQLILGASYVATSRPALAGAAAVTWTAGKIQALKSDYSLYAPAGADAAYDGPLMFLRYDADQQIYATEFIHKSDIAEVNFQDWAAAVAQRVDVDCTGLTPVKGNTVGVNILNTTNRPIQYPGRKMYLVTSTGVLATDLANVAAAINADDLADATAVVAGNVLQITAKAYDPIVDVTTPILSVVAEDDFSGATITTGVTPVIGYGTSDQLAAIEQGEDWGESQGVKNFREFAVLPPSYVVSGTGYNVATLNLNTKWAGQGGVPDGNTAPKTIILAIDKDGTGAAAFKTLIQTWIGTPIDNTEDAG